MDAEGSRRRERKELEERSEQVKVEKETKKRGKIGFKKGEEEIRRSEEKAKGECKEEGSKVLQVFEGMKKGGKKGTGTWYGEEWRERTKKKEDG